MVLTADDGGWPKRGPVWTISSGDRQEIKYSYGEAIDLAGNGWYNVSLMMTLSMTTMAMGLDMFGFSVVVAGATCDLNLDLKQTGVLLSMAFVGPIVMAYPWGYISDTQGRKKSIVISMWVSFIVSTASAFSPHWIVMAVLKFISTSLCSCTQSAAYTLLGECTRENDRDAYILILTSVLDFCLAVYVSFAYFILNLDFGYDLGFIIFTPWRLLSLVLALSLGLGAFGMHFFYESPKFLVNMGRTDEALDILSNIWRRNGGKRGQYPVKNIYLDEEGNERRKDVSFLRSLWEQIVPLFKPPLLYRSLQLYFLAAVVYGANNSYFVWFPILVEKFFAGFSSQYSIRTNTSHEQINGLCNIIINEYNASATNPSCSTSVDISLVWAGLVQGASFVIILLAISKIAYRKKTLTIFFLVVSALSSIGAVLIQDNITSFIMFFGVLFNELCIGFILSYFVDLYPTSYRGTAACIGAMVARAGSLGGINVLGAYITTHCDTLFYGCGALMFSAILVSCLLPPDKSRKK